MNSYDDALTDEELSNMTPAALQATPIGRLLATSVERLGEMPLELCTLALRRLQVSAEAKMAEAKALQAYSDKKFGSRRLRLVR